MTTGRLIAVVGPSGVGKDSIIKCLHAALPNSHLVKRVITRAPNLGGEEYDAVSVSEFAELSENGEFAIHWRAHGLYYAIPCTVMHHLNKGTDCYANFSRKALKEASEVFPNFVVLNITARPETLAARLTARGRETADEIEKRLAVAQKPLPKSLNAFNISNDGPIEQTVARAVALLQPASV